LPSHIARCARAPEAEEPARAAAGANAGGGAHVRAGANAASGANVAAATGAASGWRPPNEAPYAALCAAYERTGSVEEACEEAGVPRSTGYRWLKRGGRL
jgi:hypothetical protein